MLYCCFGQGVSSHYSGAIIVGSVETCTRVWNLDCDNRNPRLNQFGSDAGRTVLIGLEFDHQIDSFADEDLRIFYGYSGTITIAQFNQLNSRIERSSTDNFG